jgi:response regulator RpfG family c-di-GMP phosphodiesterase
MPEEVETIRTAALLHDIGEIGIPEDVLEKSQDYMTQDDSAALQPASGAGPDGH